MVWAEFVTTSIILGTTSKKKGCWRHGGSLCWKGLGRTLLQVLHLHVVTLHACTRGKAIGSVRLSVSTNIARSGDLVRCKYHYSVGNMGKLPFFCLLGAWKFRTTIAINCTFLSATPFDDTQFMLCVASTAHVCSLKAEKYVSFHTCMYLATC